MDDPLTFEVISRLERLEARMHVVERHAAAGSANSAGGAGMPAAEVERLLREQATELEALRARLVAAEEHLLRLVGSMERFMEGGPQLPKFAPAAATATAFRTYLDQAVAAEPAVPTPLPEAVHVFRPRIVRQGEDRPQPGPRRPLTPLT